MNALEIQNWLLDQIAAETGQNPAEIDINLPFAAVGLDSVQAISLTGELEDLLGIELEPTLIFEYPTISRLAKFLAQEVAQK